MNPSIGTIGFDITQKERGRIFINFEGIKNIFELEHFTCEEFNEFPITYESLQKNKLLIFACPDSSKFKQEEIEALLNYVFNGGKILLLNHAGGDQGRRTNLGALTHPFGIIFNNNEVLDSISNLDIDSFPLINTFNDHPLLQNIKNLCYRIGCSLDISGNAIPLALTANSAEPPQKAVLGLISYGKGHILVSGSYEMFQDEVKGGITYPNNAMLIKNIAQWLNSSSPAGLPEISPLKKTLPTPTLEIDSPLQAEKFNEISPSKSTGHKGTRFNKLIMELQKLKIEFQRLSTENIDVKEKFRIIELNLSNFSVQSLSDLNLEFQNLNKNLKIHSKLVKEIQQNISRLDDRISTIEEQLKQNLKPIKLDESPIDNIPFPPPIITAETLLTQKMPSKNLKVKDEINAYKEILKILDANYQNGSLPDNIYYQKRLKFEKKLEELQ